MGRQRAAVLTGLAVVLVVLIYNLYPLILLLIISRSGDNILPAELPSPNKTSSSIKLPHLIPKIIHQVYITCPSQTVFEGTCKTKPIPEAWSGAQGSCRDIHPEYEYRVGE